MRKIAVGLALALVGWAVFLVTNTAVGPNPIPATTPSPANPYTPVCPTTTPASPTHPAMWMQRGASCPAVIATMTPGGEGT